MVTNLRVLISRSRFHKAREIRSKAGEVNVEELMIFLPFETHNVGRVDQERCIVQWTARSSRYFSTLSRHPSTRPTNSGGLIPFWE